MNLMSKTIKISQILCKFRVSKMKLRTSKRKFWNQKYINLISKTTKNLSNFMKFRASKMKFITSKMKFWASKINIRKSKII